MSDTNAHTAPPLSRPPPRWPHRMAVAGVVVLAVLAFGWWLDNYREEREWRELCVEVDRLDPGWHLDDLRAARPNPPDDRNAALRIRAAQDLMPQNWLASASAEVLEESNSALAPQQHRPDQVAAVRNTVESAADALAQTNG